MARNEPFKSETGELYQGPDRDPLQYPDPYNLKIGHFTSGLETQGYTGRDNIHAIIEEQYRNHNVYTSGKDCGGPNYEKAVVEATRMIEFQYKKPTEWINIWVQTIMIDMFKQEAAKENALVKDEKPPSKASPLYPQFKQKAGKKDVDTDASPPLVDYSDRSDSPTTGGKETVRFSQHNNPGPPPTFALPPTPPSRTNDTVRIENSTFCLELQIADRAPVTSGPLEIAAIRCVPEGLNPTLVTSYRLALFRSEFERLIARVIESGGQEPLKLTNGAIAYFDIALPLPGSGLKAVRKLVRSQLEFEEAITLLCTRRQNAGDSLNFTFFQESNTQQNHRLAARGKSKSIRITADQDLVANEAEKIGREEELGDRQKRASVQRAPAAITAGTLDTESASAKNIRVARANQTRQYQNEPTEPREGQSPGVWEQRLQEVSRVPVPGERESSPGDPIIRIVPGSLRSPGNAFLADKQQPLPIYDDDRPYSPDAIGVAVTSQGDSRAPPPSRPAATPRGTHRPVVTRAIGPISSSPAPAARAVRRINSLERKGRTASPRSSPRRSPRPSPGPNPRQNLRQSPTPAVEGPSAAPGLHRGPTAEAPSPRKQRTRKQPPQVLPPKKLQNVKRRESIFEPVPPSPALQRTDTRLSQASKKTVNAVVGIRKFVRNSISGIVPKPKVREELQRAHDFESKFQVVSARAYKRAGDKEEQPSIEAIKESEKREAEKNAEIDDEAEEADDFETPDEYLVSRLQSLQNLEELSQIGTTHDSPPWVDCCRMFQIDPQNTGFDEKVQLAGLHTKLFQYQAFGVYWQMVNSRKVGGGFVADEMGLGKTLSFLAYIVAERQLSWLWEDVNHSRQATDGKVRARHLGKPQHHANDSCPTQQLRPGWIACPCASSSPTAKLQAKLGIKLAVVPQGLINNWVEQWHQHIDEAQEQLQMKLVIAHDAANPIPAPAFGLRDSRHARFHNELGSQKMPFDLRTRKFMPDQAKPRQDRYLVLTCTPSYKKWVKKFAYNCQVRATDGKEGQPIKWVKGQQRGIVFGIAMIDECHEEYMRGKGRSGVLTDLPRNNNPFIWGYSGTPLINTPRSLEGILWAMEQHFPRRFYECKDSGWSQNTELMNYVYSRLNNISTVFETHVKRKTGTREYFEEELALNLGEYLSRFMIRRTADSTWFGRPLVKLKEHVHQDFILAHNDLYNSKLEALKASVSKEVENKWTELYGTWETDGRKDRGILRPEKLTFNTECRVQWRLRIIATFPFLVTLADASHKDHLDLTAEEVIKYKGKELYKSPYSRYLRNITESSPKCIWLRKYIERILQESGEPETKIVIATQFSPAALIVKLFIEKYIKGMKSTANGRVGLVCAGMTHRERMGVIDAFTDARDKETNQRKSKQNFQILVGTTRLIGTGLQLTRANHIVLMEPDYEFYRELQTIARVHRIGQNAQRSYSFRLIDEGSEVEAKILKREQDRGDNFGKEIVTQALEDHNTGVPFPDAPVVTPNDGSLPEKPTPEVDDPELFLRPETRQSQGGEPERSLPTPGERTRQYEEHELSADAIPTQNDEGESSKFPEGGQLSFDQRRRAHERDESSPLASSDLRVASKTTLQQAQAALVTGARMDPESDLGRVGVVSRLPQVVVAPQTAAGMTAQLGSVSDISSESDHGEHLNAMLARFPGPPPGPVSSVSPVVQTRAFSFDAL